MAKPQLDLDRCSERERGDAEHGARMSTRIAEHLDEPVARAVGGK